MSQDITNRALEKCPVQACTIRDPVSGILKTSNGALFADDLSIVAGSNINNVTPINNITKLQRVTQLANNCHRASGGSFNIPKCSFRLVDINKSGKVVDHPTTFSISPTPSSPPAQILQKPLEEAHRTLGIHITPDLKPKRQIEILHRKSKELSIRLKMNPLPPEASFLATNNIFYLPLSIPW